MEHGRFCMNCGSPLGENVRFCPTCGAPVPNTGHAGYPAGPAPVNPQPPAAPAKKRRTPLIIAALAAAAILFGVGGFFLGRTFAAPGSEPTARTDRNDRSGEKSSAEPKETDRSAAPDPAAAVLAIAEKEFTELIAGITEERVELFVTDPAVLDLTEDRKQRMSAGDREIRLYSVTRSEGFRLSAEELFQGLIAAVTAGNNACGITTVQASSIIQKLNPDNSYCYPGEADENTLYIAELRNDKTVTACMICLFNGHHAIMTNTIPVFTEDFAPRQLIELIMCELAGEKKPAVDRLQTEALPLKEDVAAVLARLTPQKAGTEKGEALIEETADKAAEHAGADYLQALQVPEPVIPLCEACSVFGDSPKQTLKWDLSGLEALNIGELLYKTAGQTLIFSDQELRDMLLTTLPQLIIGSYSGTTAVAACSVISVATSVSGLKPADTGVYWLFYETDEGEPIVLWISILENGNGCCDVSAVPLFAEKVISLAMGFAEDGSGDFRSFVLALTGE